MQKLSALRYCCSVSHFFSSTITLCISAICAVGPPNESTPIRAHVRNSFGKARRAGLVEMRLVAIASCICAPFMPPALLLANCASPRWRRGTSDRNRHRPSWQQQAARDRRETCESSRATPPAAPPPAARARAARCRRPARSSRAAAAGRVSSASSSSIVSNVQRSPRWLQNTFVDVEWRRRKRSATAATSAGGDEQEHRRWIDKATNEPWTSDPIDLRTRARDPDGAALCVALGQLVGAHQRLARRFATPRSRLRASPRQYLRAAARRPPLD